VPQQIAVGTSIIESFIAPVRLFTDGQCDRTIGISGPYCLDNVNHPAIIEIPVFSALQDKGVKSQPVSGSTAIENLSFGKPVAVDLPVTFADAAVITVIPAVIRVFDQPPDINVMVIMTVPDLTGAGKQVIGGLRRTVTDDLAPLLFTEGMGRI